MGRFSPELRPKSLDVLVGEKRFRTDTALLLAGHQCLDISNLHGLEGPLLWKKQFILRSPKGSYFLQTERFCGDKVEPLPSRDAISLYQRFKNALVNAQVTGRPYDEGMGPDSEWVIAVPFETAFPGVEDA